MCRVFIFDGSIHGERGRLYLELDHVEPKSAGGHDDLDNKALLCGPCNRAKGGRRTLIALRREAMGRSERRHSINLRVAGEWCRERLREERVRNPELGV
ncbi:MAG: HNH endonuclease [Chloroflexi bacterium]|nr:HNH endonuclease [Chloroflexota bacterium]